MLVLTTLMIYSHCSECYGGIPKVIVKLLSYCTKAKVQPFASWSGASVCKGVEFKDGMGKLVAKGWEVIKSKDEKEVIGWIISDVAVRQIFEFGYGDAPWKRAMREVKRRKVMHGIKFFGFSPLSQRKFNVHYTFLYAGIGWQAMVVERRIRVKDGKIVRGPNVEVWLSNLKLSYIRDSWAYRWNAFNVDREGFAYLSKVPIYPLFRNSHVTAIAQWCSYWGVGRGKPWKVIAGMADGVIGRCLCNLPDKPYVYEIGKRWGRFLRSVGYSGRIREKVRDSGGWFWKARFKDVRKFIDNGKPVLVTFEYRKAQRRSREKALQRRDSVSAIAVGYWVNKLGRFLICHNGLMSYERMESTGKGSGCERMGVVFYNFDGPCANIVIALTEKPSRISTR